MLDESPRVRFPVRTAFRFGAPRIPSPWSIKGETSNHEERQTMDDKMLTEMTAFVKERDLCVLATVSGGNPHCSLMAYVTDEECREVYMATRRDTAKYRNMRKNPSVSLLIDNREVQRESAISGARALTVSGTFQPIQDEEKRFRVRAGLLARHPYLEAFLEDPEAEVFGVKVSAFLLLDGLTEAHFVPV